LNRGAEAEAELARLRATISGTLSVSTEPHTLYFTERCYLPGPRDSADAASWPAFTKATAELLLAVAEPLERGRKPKHLWGGLKFPDGDGSSVYGAAEGHPEFFGYIEVSKRAEAAGHAWYRALGSLVYEFYALGVHDGRDLLGQLAAGTMTADQVNDRALDLARRVAQRIAG
jgi:hypothetical protein